MIRNDERFAGFVRRLCGLFGQNLRTIVSSNCHTPPALTLVSAHFTPEVSRTYLRLANILINYLVPEIKAVSNFFCMQQRRSWDIVNLRFSVVMSLMHS